MSVMQVDSLFGTSSKNVREFFSEGNSAFYIPFYQREYSWGVSNIEQLFEDITQGVGHLLDLKTDNEKRSAIRFLGTIILLNETSPFPNIRPKDNRAMPGKVKKVIDGQQRISSLSLLSTFVYEKMEKNVGIIKGRSTTLDAAHVTALNEIARHYKNGLRRMFCVDIERGYPTHKPTIICGSVDEWTLDGDDGKYQSEIANYIAAFIRHRITNPDQQEKLGLGSKKLKAIARAIEQSLKEVEEAHKPKSNDSFCPAWEIVAKSEETDL